MNLPDGDPGELVTGNDDIRRLLAAAHGDYLRNRTGGGYRRLSDGTWFPGYPLGYSFAYDWLGGVWEINGFDYLPAATSSHNRHTLAHLMLTDRHDPGSDLMWASMRAVCREAERRGARAKDRPLDHNGFRTEYGTGTATACCGDALRLQIAQGLGDMSYDDSELEPPKPPEVDMEDGLLRLKGWADVFRVINNVPMPLSSQALALAIADGVPNPLGNGPDPQKNPAPFHAQTKLWLQHQIGYPLTPTLNDV